MGQAANLQPQSTSRCTGPIYINRHPNGFWTNNLPDSLPDKQYNANLYSAISRKWIGGAWLHVRQKIVRAGFLKIDTNKPKNSTRVLESILKNVYSHKSNHYNDTTQIQLN